MSDPMLLRTSLTSPFGRKVRMAAIVLGINEQVNVVGANPLDENDSLRQQNPLGKMPCLVLPNGAVLYDSKTIVEYLCAYANNSDLFPSQPFDLALERSRVTLADGITDAALMMVYEGRFREQSQKSASWLSHQQGKVMRGLLAMSKNLPPASHPLAASSLSLATALGYLDWRRPVEWRSSYPELVKWLDDFNQHHPLLADTLLEASV
ncbi:MAG: glutathione S-transferase N-terminal domain-containing protein [Halomonas sp.]|uniref:glutathione S-transferase N-terminal domain-containing protein n=1 Tax=Halomonas sp. TaxID=1486246 RepID=UPI003F8EF895